MKVEDLREGLEMEFRFRRMQPEDIPQVIAIDQAAFSLPWPERSFLFELTRNENSRCWVCERVQEDSAPEIVGMLVIWLILDEAHIGTIAIEASQRCKSLGRRLLATGLLEAYAEGARVSYLEVRRGNISARKMYEAFGFVEDGVRPRYYKDNFEDAILMALRHLDPDRLEQFLKR